MKTNLTNLIRAGVVEQDDHQEGQFTTYLVDNQYILLDENGDRVFIIQEVYSDGEFQDDHVLLISNEIEDPVNVPASSGTDTMTVPFECQIWCRYEIMETVVEVR